jgi:hypothetical protein
MQSRQSALLSRLAAIQMLVRLAQPIDRQRIDRL